MAINGCKIYQGLIQYNGSQKIILEVNWMDIFCSVICYGRSKHLTQTFYPQKSSGK